MCISILQTVSGHEWCDKKGVQHIGSCGEKLKNCGVIKTYNNNNKTLTLQRTFSFNMIQKRVPQFVENTK